MIFLCRVTSNGMFLGEKSLSYCSSACFGLHKNVFQVSLKKFATVLSSNKSFFGLNHTIHFACQCLAS